MTRLWLICGPSGAGKTSVVRGLTAFVGADFVQLRRVTTRAPRPEDASGEEYEFLSVSRFLEGVADGVFAEYTLLGGALYGVRDDSLIRALDATTPTIIVCGTTAAISISKRFPHQSKIVFVYPESNRSLERSGLDLTGPGVRELRSRLRQRERGFRDQQHLDQWIEGRILRGLSRTAAILNLIRMGGDPIVLENRRAALTTAQSTLASYLRKSPF